jgi:hypothetical protein
VNFYFCETCGKRLTEVEIARGEGRDKKLNGIYCKQCAVGVMTLEMDPVDEQEPATAPVKRERPRSAAGMPGVGRKGRPTTGGEVRPARTSSTTAPAVVDPSAKRMQITIVVAGMVCVLAAVFFLSTKSSVPPSTTEKPVAKVTPKAPPPEVHSSEPKAAPPAPPPAPAGPAGTPAPGNPAGKPEDPEERAARAFDQLKKACDKLPADDKEGRLALARAFLMEHGDTIVSSRARVLMKEWTDPPPAATPATPPTPPAPPGQPAAQVEAPTNKDGTVLFEENFDGPTCPGLAWGELADGPEGSHGKVAKGMKHDTWTKLGMVDWLNTGGRKMTYTVSDRTHFRFRVFNVNSRDVEFVAVSDGKNYVHYLDSTKNAWINVDLLLKDLQDDAGKVLAAGATVSSIIIGAGSGEGAPKVLYVDDLIVIDVKQ